MSGRWRHPHNSATRPVGTIVSIALLLMTLSTPAVSQGWGEPPDHELTTRAEDHERYEAERLRQERLELEKERRRQEQMRFETERLRQENERQEQERLRLENERLRQEIEEHKQEQLRLENEELERERVRAAALRKQAEQRSQGSDSDVFEQLRTLGQLRDSGILSEEEFQNLKNRILH